MAAERRARRSGLWMGGYHPQTGHSARRCGMMPTDRRRSTLGGGDGGRDVIEAFSKYQLARGFSQHTVERRTTVIAQFARFLEPATLGDATLGHVEEWLATKQAVRTRHAYRSDLSVFYAWAVKRRLLTANPVALTDPIKLPKSLPRPLGREVFAALTTGTLRQRRMVALGLYAGLRCEEIAQLDCADITDDVIMVRDGKGAKDRIVDLHPYLRGLLVGIPRSGRLFTRSGRPISSEAVSRTISRQFARCGITAKPHQLRHTFGTEMARCAHGNLVSVRTSMGHESMQTTMGYVGWSGESAPIIASMFRDGPGAA